MSSRSFAEKTLKSFDTGIEKRLIKFQYGAKIYLINKACTVFLLLDATGLLKNPNYRCSACEEIS